MALLDIQGLKTHFKTDDGWLHAVDGVDISIEAGETVCDLGAAPGGWTSGSPRSMSVTVFERLQRASLLRLQFRQLDRVARLAALLCAHGLTRGGRVAVLAGDFDGFTPLRVVSEDPRLSYWRADQGGASRHAFDRHHPRIAAGAHKGIGLLRRKPRVQREAGQHGGFVGHEDRRTLTRLRELPPAKLAARQPAFEDGRLDELLFRYRARNFPDTLSDAEQQQWHEHRVHRLHDGAGGGLTLQAFFERIDQLSSQFEDAADERSQDILGALVDHATEIAPELP